MLDIKLVREKTDFVRASLAKRGQKTPLEELISVDKEWRRLRIEADKLKHLKNVGAEEIKTLKSHEKQQKIKKMAGIAEKIRATDEKLREYAKKTRVLSLMIPNIPDSSVPAGNSEKDNVEIRRYGKPRKIDFKPEEHWETGEKLGIIDFESGVKLAGAGFYTLKGMGASLERALINFMIDVHLKQGYTEVFPPLLVNPDVLVGSGNLPKFEDDLYKCEKDNMYMIPTAETPLVALHSNGFLTRDELPKRYVSYTPCFRREAGRHADTRGIIRVHQFNKVELVKITEPETSNDELEKLVNDAEEILKLLKIPYRVMHLCAGDLGFTASKTYDIEAWLPSQNGYVEVSSCSNCTDFQARRNRIKYREKPHLEAKYVHTLNGSGMAVGRTMAAILENYQNEDGSVNVPDVLKKYMNIDSITKII
ncbi:MAG: serine--tRNA ligase [Thermoplasmatales archaeon]|nr:serine--tRNA ligase [Thermoplasmatales archaeon]